eukprot:UN28461
MNFLHTLCQSEHLFTFKKVVSFFAGAVLQNSTLPWCMILLSQHD